MLNPIRNVEKEFEALTELNYCSPDTHILKIRTKKS